MLEPFNASRNLYFIKTGCAEKSHEQNPFAKHFFSTIQSKDPEQKKAPVRLREIPVKECIFCADTRFLIQNETTPRYPETLSQSGGYFGARIRHTLYEKYSSSQNYYFSKEICDFLAGSCNRGSIRIKDTISFYESQEHLKQFYSSIEYKDKIKMLTEYYKFHRDIARLFMLPSTTILNTFHDRRRKNEFNKITKMLNSEEESEDKSERYLRNRSMDPGEFNQAAKRKKEAPKQEPEEIYFLGKGKFFGGKKEEHEKGLSAISVEGGRTSRRNKTEQSCSCTIQELNTKLGEIIGGAGRLTHLDMEANHEAEEKKLNNFISFLNQNDSKFADESPGNEKEPKIINGKLAIEEEKASGKSVENKGLPKDYERNKNFNAGTKKHDPKSPTTTATGSVSSLSSKRNVFQVYSNENSTQKRSGESPVNNKNKKSFGKVDAQMSQHHMLSQQNLPSKALKEVKPEIIKEDEANEQVEGKKDEVLVFRRKISLDEKFLYQQDLTGSNRWPDGKQNREIRASFGPQMDKNREKNMKNSQARLLKTPKKEAGDILEIVDESLNVLKAKTTQNNSGNNGDPSQMFKSEGAQSKKCLGKPQTSKGSKIKSHREAMGSNPLQKATGLRQEEIKKQKKSHIFVQNITRKTSFGSGQGNRSHNKELLSALEYEDRIKECKSADKKKQKLQKQKSNPLISPKEFLFLNHNSSFVTGTLLSSNQKEGNKPKETSKSGKKQILNKSESTQQIYAHLMEENSPSLGKLIFRKKDQEEAKVKPKTNKHQYKNKNCFSSKRSGIKTSASPELKHEDYAMLRNSFTPKTENGTLLQSQEKLVSALGIGPIGGLIKAGNIPSYISNHLKSSKHAKFKESLKKHQNPLDQAHECPNSIFRQSTKKAALKGSKINEKCATDSKKLTKGPSYQFLNERSQSNVDHPKGKTSKSPSGFLNQINEDKDEDTTPQHRQGANFQGHKSMADIYSHSNNPSLLNPSIVSSKPPLGQSSGEKTSSQTAKTVKKQEKNASSGTNLVSPVLKGKSGSQRIMNLDKNLPPRGSFVSTSSKQNESKEKKEPKRSGGSRNNLDSPKPSNEYDLNCFHLNEKLRSSAGPQLNPLKISMPLRSFQQAMFTRDPAFTGSFKSRDESKDKMDSARSLKSSASKKLREVGKKKKKT